MQQQHSGNGDNVGGNKIDRLVETGIYTENHYYYGEKKIFRALTKPPFMPEVFLGREDDLLTIKDKLFSGDNLLLLVNGQGGVGKTSIAAKYYEAYNTHYAHTAWVLSEKSITNALLFNLVTPLGIELEQNWTEVQRFDEILRGMVELKKPCLLVIDNANELTDLEQNYPYLISCRNFHVLLTTRITKFEKAALHPIEGLKEADAVKMFKRHYSEHNEKEDDLLKEIIAAVGNNTLIVELLAKNLQNLNELEPTYHLRNLLNDIQNNLIQLSKSEVVSTIYQTKAKGLRFEKPEDIIIAMYDLSELNDAEKHLLSNFAILPAERITFDLLKLLLPQKEDLKTTLLSLAKKGWLDYSQKDKSFKISPVIQHITKLKNKETLLKDCDTLIRTLIDKLHSDIIHEDNYKMSTVFARYAETVITTFDKPHFNIQILDERIGTYYETTGNLDKAFSFYEKESNIIKQLYDLKPNNTDYKYGLAVSYSRLGQMHTALGNLANALTFYEKDIDLSKELYASNSTNVKFKNGLAVSYSKLGQTHTALGNLDKALRFYEKDIKLTKELYETYPNNVTFKNHLGISNCFLGITHTSLGNLDKALGFYEEYNRLEKELHIAYPNNVSFKNDLAISCQYLGNTHTSLGNLDKALGFYEEYNRLEKELHIAYPNNVSFKNGLAVSYSKLGMFYKDKKNGKLKARLYYEQSHLLWSELVSSYPMYVEFQNNLKWVEGKLAEK